ncbi:hypothetical protein Tco_1001022 [Tanacetum coccineum]
MTVFFGSLKFVSKTDDYQAYGALISTEMTNLKMQNSLAYKTFLAYATGAIPPKKSRKFKKPGSSSKKKTLVAAARRQSAGVQFRDTPGVSLSKKKAPAKAKKPKGLSCCLKPYYLRYDDEEDKFVHTLDDYVPTDDEHIDNEEYDRINEEMYSDVNVELKDKEIEGIGKDDEEITDAGYVDAEHENVDQEVAGDQVKDDALATFIAAPAT